jgi:hypothetical protein
MNCSNCNTVNNSENVFCITCGSPVSPVTGPLSGGFSSVDTEVINRVPPSAPVADFRLPPTYVADRPRPADNKLLWIAMGAIAAALIAVGAYIFVVKNGPNEVLPDHLGLFVQNSDRKELNEIGKQDVSNAIQARNDLQKNDSLPVLDPTPNLILFSDSQAVPINDLRLIQLDTIGDDGSIKQLDFQVAPIEGKPDMKRIRVPAPMANGKYAFALLEGFFNDGKHKFWAFQVRNSTKSDNADALKASTVNLKAASPTPPKTAVPASVTTAAAAPPAPGNTAVSTTDYLILRAGPSQSYPKVRNLARGESVYILGYSTTTESFKGRSAPFAQVRTGSGQIGWVFSAFLR